MKSIFYQLIISTRRILWALIVAFMLGLHNFYKGEDKSPDNIGVTIEISDVKAVGEPKD